MIAQRAAISSPPSDGRRPGALLPRLHEHEPVATCHQQNTDYPVPRISSTSRVFWRTVASQAATSGSGSSVKAAAHAERRNTGYIPRPGASRRQPGDTHCCPVARLHAKRTATASHPEAHSAAIGIACISVCTPRLYLIEALRKIVQTGIDCAR